MRPVFLSASIPDPLKDQDREHAATVDVTAIRECIRSLVLTVLPHGRLVFGGHPAITPFIRILAEQIDALDQVTLFQSAFFEREFLKDNRAFANPVIVPAVGLDRAASLTRMREDMIASEPFCAGVFVGGMEGVVEEFELFRRLQPKARVLAMASTGGAALAVAARPRGRKNILNLNESAVYAAVFEEHLPLPRGRRRAAATGIKPKRPTKGRRRRPR